MALPWVSATSTFFGADCSNNAGPYKSTAGNIYFLNRLTTGSGGGISAWKATDPTSSFTEQDTGVRPIPGTGNTPDWWHTAQVGDKIHLVMYCSNINYDMYYARFDMSTDTWDTITGSIKSQPILTAIDAQSNAINCTIGVRSDGDIVIHFTGDREMDMGGMYSRTYYTVSTDSGVNWSTAVMTNDNTDLGINWGACTGSTLDLDDRYHFIIAEITNAETWWRTLNASDSLNTARLIEAVTSGQFQSGQGVSYDDAGTTKVKIPYYTSNTGMVALSFSSANNPSASKVTITAWADAIPYTTYGRAMKLAANGTTAYCFYISSTDNDLWYDVNVDDAGWGTDTEFYDRTNDALMLIGVNVYDRSGLKVGVIWQEASGVVIYHELDIGVASIFPYRQLSGPLLRM